MVLMADPWANLRGVPVPIRERCGANTRTKIGQCQNEADLCGLHPRRKPYPYKRQRVKPDGRTERARRSRAELREAFDEMRREDAARCDAEMTRRLESDSSNPPENPGPERGRARRSQQAAPRRRFKLNAQQRQAPAQDGPDDGGLNRDSGPLLDDGSPEVAAIARVLGFPAPPSPRRRTGFRSARLRHLNPNHRPSEREYDPPDGPPDPGDGEPVREAG